VLRAPAAVQGPDIRRQHAGGVAVSSLPLKSICYQNCWEVRKNTFIAFYLLLVGWLVGRGKASFFLDGQNKANCEAVFW